MEQVLNGSMTTGSLTMQGATIGPMPPQNPDQVWPQGYVPVVIRGILFWQPGTSTTSVSVQVNQGAPGKGQTPLGPVWVTTVANANGLGQTSFRIQDPLGNPFGWCLKARAAGQAATSIYVVMDIDSI